MINLLALTVLLPLLGAGGIWAWSEGGRAAARLTALVTSLVTLALAGWLVFQYPDVHTEFEYGWLRSSGVDVNFNLGLDGLSLWMFGLSALLTVTAVLVSWEAIEDRAPAFFALLLLLVLVGFNLARIHRTRLANLDRVSRVQSKPSGDFDLTFDSGHTVSGSRRYRSTVASRDRPQVSP